VKQPLIGINCHLRNEGKENFYRLNQLYVKAIERVGGIPLILPFFETAGKARKYVDRIDGLILTGGDDPNPKRWKEKPHPKMESIVPEKEESDFHLARSALRKDKPILGICYGMQLLNILQGGSLHQHIGDIPGAQKHEGGSQHNIEMVGSSRTRDLIGRKRKVNSYHHQSVHRLGKGLHVSGVSPDGIIEGLESAQHRWVIGIQWHPERMTERRDQANLFRALVSEAKS
jgi:putative glutamine amidotransferase